MNRAVWTIGEPPSANLLPPQTREGPARVLFLHAMEVGFATTTENLIHYAADRADIDALHVRLAMPRWLKIACTQSPFPVGELDYRYLRHMLFWRMHLRTLLGPGRALPPDRFDAVHITTQQRALIIRDFARPGVNPTRTKFAVNLDATLRNWESMRGLRRLAPPFDRSIEGRILRSADMLACATTWAAESCVGQYAAVRDRVVIHKPCAIVPPRDGAPEDLRRPGGLVRIVFVGGNWADKGGPRLLRWHQQRWADRAELHIVSGSAPPDASARNVVWHARVPHGILVGRLLPSMDIFAVPTKWDTFMIAAQEAQAAGLPVVTTRTGGVAECVLDGTTGFLCDPESDEQYIRALEGLLADAGLRARMGAAAARHARTALSADVWHTHLLNNLVALADERPLLARPEGLSTP